MGDLEIDLCKYFNAPDTILWSLLNYFKRLYSLFIVCVYTQSDFWLQQWLLKAWLSFIQTDGYCV